MFEKKKEKKLPFDTDKLEEIKDPSRFKYANRIYMKNAGILLGIRPDFTIYHLEGGGVFLGGISLNNFMLKEIVKEGKAKLYKTIQDVDA